MQKYWYIYILNIFKFITKIWSLFVLPVALSAIAFLYSILLVSSETSETSENVCYDKGWKELVEILLLVMVEKKSVFSF